MQEITYRFRRPLKKLPSGGFLFYNRGMKKQKQFEDFCNKTLEKLQKKLLLDSFNLQKIKYKKDMKARAECDFHYPYKEILVRYSDELYDDFIKNNIKDVKLTLIHEMCHVITDPMYSIACDRYITKQSIEDIRENTTDHLSNIFYKNNIL